MHDLIPIELCCEGWCTPDDAAQDVEEGGEVLPHQEGVLAPLAGHHLHQGHRAALPTHKTGIRLKFKFKLK